MSKPNEAFRDKPPVERPPAEINFSEEETNIAAGPPDSDRKSAIICHIGGFFTWFLLPFILWKVQTNPTRFLSDHAKEALNFQLALTIYYIVLCPLFPLLLIYETWYIVRASMAASRGEPYRIPFNIRFVK